MQKIKEQIEPSKTEPIGAAPEMQVPQHDQSHPIPPELIMDSNITTPIHDKHIQHEQRY